MKRTTILGIQVTEQCKNTSEIQKVFSTYGCSIRTRIGLHGSEFENCSPGGLVLIEAIGNPDEIHSLRNKLTDINGVLVKSMEFNL